MKRLAPLAIVFLVGCSAMMPSGPAGPKKYLPDTADAKALKAGENALAFLEGNWVEEETKNLPCAFTPLSRTASSSS